MVLAEEARSTVERGIARYKPVAMLLEADCILYSFTVSNRGYKDEI